MPPHLRLARTPGPARSAGGPITVVLADDHEGVRHSLRLLLDGERDLEVVAEASDLEQTRRALRRYRPQVVVLDLTMADSAIDELRARARDTRMVVVSMNDTPAYARALLDAGAAGFVLKELADSDLPPAIRRTACGETYVSPRMAERMAEPMPRPPGTR
jgi:two-component system response regulator NreC